MTTCTAWNVMNTAGPAQPNRLMQLVSASLESNSPAFQKTYASTAQSTSPRIDAAWLIFLIMPHSPLPHCGRRVYGPAPPRKAALR